MRGKENGNPDRMLTLLQKPSILNKPCSRGVSGVLYLQPATAGVMHCLRALACIAALYKRC